MLDPYADNVKRGAHEERAASEGGAYMKPRAAGGKAGGVKPPPQADIYVMWMVRSQDSTRVGQWVTGNCVRRRPYPWPPSE